MGTGCYGVGAPSHEPDRTGNPSPTQFSHTRLRSYRPVVCCWIFRRRGNNLMQLKMVTSASDGCSLRRLLFLAPFPRPIWRAGIRNDSLTNIQEIYPRAEDVSLGDVWQGLH